MKVYKYKDKEFTFKTFSLDMMNKQGRLLKEYEKLRAKEELELRGEFPEYSIKDEYDKALDRYRQALDTLPDSDITERERLEGLLEKKLEEYENDGRMKVLDKLIKESENANLVLLVTDMKIVKPFIEDVLNGDVHSIDWSDVEVAKFVGEVIMDFFTLSQTSKEE
jgi:hypothetical protein